MVRNVGRAVIVKGGKDSSLDCALFNTYRRSKEPSENKTLYTLKAFKSTLADELSYKYKGTRWLRGLGTPNSATNRRQRGRKALGIGKIICTLYSAVEIAEGHSVQPIMN